MRENREKRDEQNSVWELVKGDSEEQKECGPQHFASGCGDRSVVDVEKGDGGGGGYGERREVGRRLESRIQINFQYN